MKWVALGFLWSLFVWLIVSLFTAAYEIGSANMDGEE